MAVLDIVKQYLQTPQQKASVTLIVIFGILWFSYFVVACTYLGDPLNSSALRVWVTQPRTDQPGNLVFPQLTICPHGSLSGSFVSLQCDNFDWYKNRLVKTLKPVYLNNIFSDYPSWTCYTYNSDGADSAMDYVNCTGEVTPDCTALHAFFDDPGTGKYFFDGSNRPSGDDNWINIKGTKNDIGLELSIWDSRDPMGGPVGTTSISDPTRKYKVDAQITSTTEGNLTHLNIWWGSNDVWHYEKYSPFVFIHWVGLIGGCAFLLKMLYDIIMGIVNRLFPVDRQGYAENNNSYSNTYFF